ncbi:MAG: hypothetical protein O7G85_13600 [Planctomycetota bacterium]|nr:hypothetical protein [Planctomycetota bacterium]
MMTLLAQVAQNAATGQGDESYLMWGFILLAVAFGLLVLEMFIPSGGLIGALCGITAIGSIVSFFKFDTIWGVVALGGYIVMTPVVIVFVFKFWLHSNVAKWMILGGNKGIDDISEEASIASEHARSVRNQELRELIGTRGTSITALRPVGKVRIEGRRIDAMAESGTIDADMNIVVVDVYDNQIKVRLE